MLDDQSKIDYKIPLSPYSEIFYNEWKLDPSRSDYNIVFDQSIEGEIDILKLDKAIKRFILDHLLFNSYIQEKNEELFWTNNPKICGLKYFDSPLTNQEILSYVQRPFNLELGPLYRFALINNQNKKYRFIIVIHHIIIDGQSFDYFVNSISNYYNDSTYKINISIEQQLLKIIKSSEYLFQYLQLIKEKSKLFWKQKLLDIEILDLKFLKYDNDISRKSSLSVQNANKISEVKFSFDKKILLQLNNLKTKYGISHYLFSQGIYALLLHKYTGQNKFGISYPIAIKECEDFFYGGHINTNILVYDFTKINTIIDLIEQLQEFIASLKYKKVNHGYLPISDILSVSNKDILTLSFIKTNLKDTVFEFKNIKIDSINTNNNIDLSSELLFEQEIKNEKVNFRVKYRLDKIDTFLLNELIDTYKCFFRRILNELSNIDYKGHLNNLYNYSVLSTRQYQQIIQEWNRTEKAYPSDKTIHQLFEEQVEKTPDSIAVICENQRLTYRELNEKANQLAHYIRKNHDIRPDTLIVLCLDRSEYILVAILGVLKAGGAYVPMDTSYPDERVRYILKDTEACLILTNEVHKERIEKIIKIDTDDTSLVGQQINREIKVLPIDSKELGEELFLQLTTNLKTETVSNDLAYVIYTSGTTGNPKGVMQLHKNVMRLFTATDDWYKFENGDIWVLFHSYVFDFSVWEIWGALIYGGKLIVPSYEETHDFTIFYELCKQEKVTVLNQTPSSFYQFSEIAIHKNIQDKLTELRYVIFGGEALNITQLRPWFDYYGYNQPKLINMYGITETTVHVTYKIIEYQDLEESSYIGKVIPDLKAYVLDSHLKPLPIGAIGELYIGGEGLARGYLNNKELTNERFISNPFQTEEERKDKINSLEGKNTRLYKTGDLVRWLPDGNLEYIGRNDFQVKIRGYRIELGEIEKALSSYDGIKQSVVLAKEHKDILGKVTGQRYLVGYYVSDNIFDNEKIFNYLQTKLPEYMIPSVLIHLEYIPLTINGKLDRDALPDPTFTNEKNYIAPRNELEQQIVEIWAEVLGLPKDTVGIQDDFFRLGGDSIVSIQVVSRLRQRLKLLVSVKDIFSYKTIAKLYEHVLSNQQGESTQVETESEQGLLEGEVSLLPIQEWFFENRFNAINHWNQSFMIRTPNLDITRLQESFVKLVDYHDAFRLRYKKVLALTNNQSEYIQYYDTLAQKENIKTLDLNTLKSREGTEEFEEELQTILTNWQSSFNIETGPVYSVGYLYGYKDGSTRIYFAMHHLIVDAVSWRILIDNLKDLYYGKDIVSKGTSYRQFVNSVKDYARTNEKEKDYWVTILSDYKEDILTDLIVSEDTQNSYDITLTQEMTKNLLGASNRAYNTEVNDLLLTALGYALAKITKTSINHITLEGHGREEIKEHINITNTLGWFTTMYPLRLQTLEDIGQSIKNIKEVLRQIPNKGIGYGALIGYKNRKLPRISFNYLGQFDGQDIAELVSQGSYNKSNWSIVEENSGISAASCNHDYNIININGMVINGSLKFNFFTKLDKRTTEEISQLFKQTLEQLIEYCICKDYTEYTMGDFNGFDPYIILHRTVKNNNRLFLFPPGGGGAESYLRNITLKLQEIELVVFNNYYDYLKNNDQGYLLQLMTYEKLASNYISYIKTIQTKGPYHLFGWSFGGVLAFEIARQLIHIGDNVENILIVDSFFNYKKAVIETNTGTTEELSNINYKYLPGQNIDMDCSNIILFKAIKLADNFDKISEYYTKNTIYNNLDTILKNNSKIKIVDVNDDHNSWIDNKFEVIKVSNTILSIFRNK